jgi:hypothetical protein
MRRIEKDRSSGSTTSRLPLAARVASAVFGGYALAHSLPIAFAAIFPVARAEAALLAIQGSFLVYAAAVLWAFAARSVAAACLGLLIPSVMLGLVGWMLL